MPRALPLVPSTPNYRVSTTLDGVQYVLDVRWNGRSGVWYLDIRDVDEDPIAMGIAVVLGSALGIRTVDARFPPGALIAADMSGEGRDAGFDDLGDRVKVFYYSADEAEAL
jgi:hypothetical protein